MAIARFSKSSLINLNERERNLSFGLNGTVGLGGDSVFKYGNYQVHKYTTVGTSSFVLAKGGVIDFLIKGISHTISGNQWKTKIESLTVSSLRK